ncbi:ribonuclease PH [Haloplasma contractile]|nr:ribonuclease PH [Haloplasma contractile]
MRHDERLNDQIRNVTFELDYTIHAEGSVLVSFGNTKVLCNASIDEKVPIWLRGGNKGWVAAEYSMLPRATATRNIREAARGKLSGRTMEIQRLIGRAFRSVIDLDKLGERTIVVDCDVIQADGGTRTASITGGFLALKIAVNKLLKDGKVKEDPIKEYLAAISVGINNDDVILDLDYVEDSKAQVDMNIVMTEGGNFVEIQGTGEEATFNENQLGTMLSYAKRGISQLILKQQHALGENDEGTSNSN